MFNYFLIYFIFVNIIMSTIKGDTGQQGLQGLQGLQGIIGEPGLTGPQGIQGFQGPQGPRGAAGGPTGPQGFKGPTGIKGNTGVQGDRGAKGNTGIQGGIQGSENYLSTATTLTFVNPVTTFDTNLDDSAHVSKLAINSTQTRMVVVDFKNNKNWIFTRSTNASAWSLPPSQLSGIVATNIVMSADGERLVITTNYDSVNGDDNPYVLKWNYSTLTYDVVGRISYVRNTGQYSPIDIAMSADGNRVAFRNANGFLYFATWDNASNNYTNVTQTLENRIDAQYNLPYGQGGYPTGTILAMSGDGNRIAYGSTVKYGFCNWNGTNYGEWQQITSLNNTFKNGGALNYDGSILYINGKSICLYLTYNSGSNTFSAPLQIPTSIIPARLFESDGFFLLAPNSNVLYWSLTTGDINTTDTIIYSTEITVKRELVYINSKLATQDFITAQINKLIQDYGLQLIS
jgi:hypothetical protein